MVIILMGLLLYSSTLGAASNNKDMFNQEQREQAKQFIDICFKQVKKDVSRQIDYLETEAELTNEEASIVLHNQDQIDYVKLSQLDQYGDHIKKKLKKQREYSKSILRPQKEIEQWNEGHEQSAYALYSFMQITQEFKEYKADPSSQKKYAILHAYMLDMAGTLADRYKSSYLCFSSGTHARSHEDDVAIDYDVDRVLFLALYLMDHEMKKV